MRTFQTHRRRGYISYVTVVVTGLILSLLMVYVYRTSLRAQEAQKVIQVRTDLHSKEDAMLRALVAIIPNRAIRCMQSGSAATEESRAALQWKAIFSEAIDQANARNAISEEVATALELGEAIQGNTGDSDLTNLEAFVSPVDSGGEPPAGLPADAEVLVSSGLNHNFGSGFPPVLNVDASGEAPETDLATVAADFLYPLISDDKRYGSFADGHPGVGASVQEHTQYNKIRYPNINFGYAKPGEWFVAKRNWWAFTLNLGAHDSPEHTGGRDYVLSIYEIPSQLAISTNAFVALGRTGDGRDWENISIQGRVFAGRAQLEGNLTLEGISGRRDISFADNVKVGGQLFAGRNPFEQGLREQHELNSHATGEFFPVSLPSESGRAAFVPINRGSEFFDRFALLPEESTISNTTWNNYSVGALQCAMKLDLVDVAGSDATGSQLPTELRFTYKKGGVDAPPVTFIVDGSWDDGGPETTPPFPFARQTLPGNKPCIVIKPERLPAYLASLGADPPSINHSLAVNSDYTVSTKVRRPNYPSEESDVGLIMVDAANISPFTKGFSLVTSMRLYIGSDFNVVNPVPTSIFAPERRYGSDTNPQKVEISGQISSLASESRDEPVRPFDIRSASGEQFAPDKITVNLTPITDPSKLPPIVLKNWLVTIEERRR